MNLLITGHHVELTPTLRQYVEEKVERVTRHFDHVMEVEVILALEGTTEKERRQRAEVNLRVPGDTLHAQCYAQDLYAAVDMVVEKLDRQMDRYKAKLRDHNNLAAKHIQPSA